ncbi:EAL domain-containing protein [Parendozoicomonas haliclonae]|uniref:Lichenan permease IIC component n=1 Tax=Parendozoicomonas haliclonae TaxID=1960125 RepID=A0A1X7AMH4_9GAMM|nr:EAL domain-containing protein [Parendozoicomonas haliclonae]SMA49496.1 Lichenan permease IIC component [Parendozoicomonas haliclonae]
MGDARTRPSIFSKIYWGKFFPADNTRNSYAYDIASLALLLLPLTLSSSLTFGVGNLFEYLELGTAAAFVLYISKLLHNLYPLCMCIIVAYYFSHKTSLGSVNFIFYSLCLFYLVSVEGQRFSPIFNLPNNSFYALVCPIATYLYCKKFKLQFMTYMSMNLNLQLFRHTLHFSIFILLAMLLAKATSGFSILFNACTQELGANPFSVSGGLMYQLVITSLSAIGIHGPNMMFATHEEIEELTTNNIAVWEAGNGSLNIISEGFYEAFLAMGGSGSTLCLLLCILMFSRQKSHIMLALTALPLSLFNINEIVVFGLPIIFNPLLMIPFIITPLVLFLVTYGAMFIGLVPPVQTILSWMTPPLISGYIATGESVSGVVLQIILLAIGTLIYKPFYLAFAGRQKEAMFNSYDKEIIDKSLFRNLLTSIRASALQNKNLAQSQQRMMRLFKEGSLVMHYQQIKPVKDRDCLYFEALIRYRDEFGKMQPPTFIKDIQALNMMPMLDRMVIDQVLTDLKQIPASTNIRVAINISVASAEQADAIDYMLSRINHFEVPSHWLEVEITEEAMLSSKVHLKDGIERLHEHGIKVSMDDFGSGYASFPHLMKYSFDKIKLDRSLLLDAHSDKGKELYRLVASLGHISQCEVVAEGIETEDEYEFVKSCGIDLAQGFLFSRPQPMTEILPLITSAQQK